MMKKFSPDLKEFRAKLNEFGTYTAVSKFYQVSRTTGTKFAKENNLGSSVRKNFTDKEREYICNNYENKTALELAKEFESSKSAIIRIWKLGGKSGKVARRYTLGREDYFEIINTKDKAYFLGFIFGDGCIYDREEGNYQQLLQISIHKKDRYILDRLKGYLETNKPIGEVYNMRCLSIVSDKICNDLQRYGVVPRKSEGCNVDNIPKEFERFLIRGLFDSDGCMKCSNRKNLPSSYSIVFDGCEGIIRDISKYLDGLKIKYYRSINDGKKYRNPHHTLEIYGVQNMIDFYNIVYKGDIELGLDRKRRRFDAFLNAILIGTREYELKGEVRG